MEPAERPPRREHVRREPFSDDECPQPPQDRAPFFRAPISTALAPPPSQPYHVSKARMFDSADLLEKAPRRRFERVLLERCRTGTPFALMLVNLDGFKNVSTRFGANVTDLLLFEVGSRLREKLSPQDLVTRSGDHQFAVFVEGVDDIGAANQIAEEIIERLQSPVTVTGTRFTLDASVGVSISPRQSGEWRILLRDADQAAHDARREGRGRISITFEAPKIED